MGNKLWIYIKRNKWTLIIILIILVVGFSVSFLFAGIAAVVFAIVRSSYYEKKDKRKKIAAPSIPKPLEGFEIDDIPLKIYDIEEDEGDDNHPLKYILVPKNPRIDKDKYRITLTKQEDDNIYYTIDIPGTFKTDIFSNVSSRKNPDKKIEYFKSVFRVGKDNIINLGGKQYMLRKKNVSSFFSKIGTYFGAKQTFEARLYYAKI